MLSDDSNGSAPPGVGVGCQDADFLLRRFFCGFLKAVVMICVGSSGGVDDSHGNCGAVPVSLCCTWLLKLVRC